jgi:hypothetical protein
MTSSFVHSFCNIAVSLVQRHSEVECEKAKLPPLFLNCAFGHDVLAAAGTWRRSGRRPWRSRPPAREPDPPPPRRQPGSPRPPHCRSLRPQPPCPRPWHSRPPRSWLASPHPPRPGLGARDLRTAGQGAPEHPKIPRWGPRGRGCCSGARARRRGRRRWRAPTRSSGCWRARSRSAPEGSRSKSASAPPVWAPASRSAGGLGVRGLRAAGVGARRLAARSLRAASSGAGLRAAGHGAPDQ